MSKSNQKNIFLRITPQNITQISFGYVGYFIKYREIDTLINKGQLNDEYYYVYLIWVKKKKNRLFYLLFTILEIQWLMVLVILCQGNYNCTFSFQILFPSQEEEGDYFETSRSLLLLPWEKTHGLFFLAIFHPRISIFELHTIVR